jgi:hypothetical protein
MPGLPACDGLACHTAELAFVFEQHEVTLHSHHYHSMAMQSIDTTSKQNHVRKAPFTCTKVLTSTSRLYI